jgi:hypothetical protein
VAPVYVIAEDRPDSEIGLRFTLASLFAADENANVVAYWPCVTEDFRTWASRFKGLRLIPRRPVGASSWNCKPNAILPLIRKEFDEAIWLDSDLLVTRDPAPLFKAVATDAVVLTEEPPSQLHVDSAILATRWGMRPGRSHLVSPNSSVLRVTRVHIPLLERWQTCLSDPYYLEAQRKPLEERPKHLLSDQDVLFALLGSEEFSSLPLRYLRGGLDVIHCGGALGYSLRMRLAGLFRHVPTFLHAISGKPWWVLSAEYANVHGRWFTFYRRLLQETSPYVREAKRFRAAIAMNAPWLDYHTVLGTTLRMFGLGHFALCGLPLTVAATAAVGVKRAARGIPKRGPIGEVRVQRN